MSNELEIRKCKKCGTTIKVLKTGGCKPMCCGDEIEALVPNSVDAAVEKHVPNYEIKDDRIYVTVNHVMEEEHYIEWISLVNNGRECITYFKPGMEATAHFKYIPGATIYAYCNKHELWKAEVK